MFWEGGSFKIKFVFPELRPMHNLPLATHMSVGELVLDRPLAVPTHVCSKLYIIIQTFLSVSLEIQGHERSSCLIHR